MSPVLVDLGHRRKGISGVRQGLGHGIAPGYELRQQRGGYGVASFGLRSKIEGILTIMLVRQTPSEGDSMTGVIVPSTTFRQQLKGRPHGCALAGEQWGWYTCGAPSPPHRGCLTPTLSQRKGGSELKF